MLETPGSLLPNAPSAAPLKVVSVGVQDQDEKNRGEPSLEEMARLLETLGVNCVASVPFVVRQISPATFIGKGQAGEVKNVVDAQCADAVVLDCDLSPNQLRNLEKLLGKPTLDRSGVIIEIFSRHARSKEAKTQVELARLEYLMPRLAHFWTHFERQRGGIGMKGMGEKQLEVDRRLLKHRMKRLKERLKEIMKEREIQRAGREGFLKVALVGYTNAGKSTLLNALTRSHVRAEDKLFATLDSSVRALNPDSHPPVVAVDTVGFISRIPTGLIASFRSTLEEVYQSDLLLHVVDASSPYGRQQFETTEEILRDLHLESKPRMSVLNKMDEVVKKEDRGALNWARLAVPGALRVSAFNVEDVDRLRDSIMKHFQAQLELWEVVIPYSESRLQAQLSAYGDIEKTAYLEQGVFYRLRIHPGWARKLELENYRP